MAEDLDPSSSWGCKMHTFWRNDKSIYYETKPEYKGDPKPSQPQAASSGPFWYARGLLHYGTGWDGEKVPLWYLRMIYKNRAFMSRKPGWYQAQLRHYGVPFKRTDDKEEVFCDAMKRGLFKQQTQKMKDLERRLTIQYQQNVAVFDKELREWEERQAARKEVEVGKEGTQDDGK
ncbi:hypothetical protein UCREL1_9817 [Eutypa lata UCREL1]|uniref:Uncharacterized protein n=1 Tax=Eutypa lata (strain UCR-EL1) TaxID=1287681 RepID=M7SGG0_EUTLA|nr:hypothetical protein UCREL1_9817 [Eutypa lata UCREL1]